MEHVLNKKHTKKQEKGHIKDQKNPHTKYPEPPFPKQRQEYPGTEAAMIPKADHGQEGYKGSGRLTGKAIITGGDSGIGKAVAIAFAREGADVLVSYLSNLEDKDAQDTAKLVEKAGRKCIVIQGDITSEEHCKNIVSEAVSAFGQIDILVNNAAFQMARKSLQDIPSDEWVHTFLASDESSYISGAIIPATGGRITI